MEANIVIEHLICDGFKHGYRLWIFHGEASSSAHCTTHEQVQVEQRAVDRDEIPEMLRDMAYGLDQMGEGGAADGSSGDANNDADDFYRLVDDASQELYPGCKTFSKLNFLVRLLHTKFLGGWSDKSFDMLLDLLREAFPEGAALPKNFYEAKKTVKSLGLGYINIHACENDCILFWKQYENYTSCPKCNTSRWKMERKSLDGKRFHKVPRKVLRYFPIKERLQRLYINPEMAKNMRWHDEGRTKDGLLRHPADSPAWKHLDTVHPTFGNESRNIRLALATDGFNPFRSLNSTHSTWPVIAIPYNVPPWMCMKQPNFILSLLIPGPTAPGNDMDVYMEPLIDDLESLWREGIRTYDASKGEFFQLRAAVLTTISDYPGLGYFHGCTTSGEVACTDCHIETGYTRLSKGSKSSYMAHRRFLDADHRFRSDTKSFDGTTEFRLAPSPLSGEDVLRQTEHLNVVFGKDPTGKKPTTKRKRGDPPILWKKRSILFRLPYWKDVMLRHSFDVMHIEKNVCDNIINTLLGIDGKSKDNLNSRLDLQLLGIRKDLHPVKVGEKYFLPPAPYTMSPDEKKMFCEVLKGVKFPDGYASNIHNNVRVNEKKLVGLKSHDNHILLQHLLPLAIRRILPERVCAALIRVSNFFKQIYSPVIRISDMQKLEAEIAETLCILETIFLPSFFDIMVHLTVHLPAQVCLGGPVLYHNMYPVER